MKQKLLFVIIVLLHAVTAFGQTKNFIDQPFIETLAHVDTLVTPDKIYVNILLSEKNTKGNTSVEDLETKMIRTLTQLGIDTKKDLTLNDLASNFKRYFLKDQDVLKSKAYSLKVDNAQMAGQVIVELEKMEISNVELDRIEFSRIEQLKLELKSKAISKAKRQAEYLATPLNQKVGAAIHISDQSDNAVQAALQGRAAGIMIRGNSFNAEGSKPADIQFEKMKVESSVFVKFKLEQ